MRVRPDPARVRCHPRVIELARTPFSPPFAPMPSAPRARDSAAVPAPELRIPLAPLYRWSGTKLAWLCAISATLVSAFVFAPRFWLWRAVGVPLTELISIQPELNRAFFGLKQLHDPRQRIDDVTNR